MEVQHILERQMADRRWCSRDRSATWIGWSLKNEAKRLYRQLRSEVSCFTELSERLRAVSIEILGLDAWMLNCPRELIQRTLPVIS